MSNMQRVYPNLYTFPLFMPFRIHDFAQHYNGAEACRLYADCWGKQSTSWETPIAGPFAWSVLLNGRWIETASACKCHAVPISPNKNVAHVVSSRCHTVADRSSFASKHEHSLHEWVHSGRCKEFSWMQAGETGVLVMSVNRRNLGREQTKYTKQPQTIRII